MLKNHAIWAQIVANTKTFDNVHIKLAFIYSAALEGGTTKSMQICKPLLHLCVFYLQNLSLITYEQIHLITEACELNLFALNFDFIIGVYILLLQVEVMIFDTIDIES